MRAAVLVSSVVAAGCGLSEQAQPLLPSQFVRARPAVGPNPTGQPVGQSGALAYGELHSPLLPDEYPNTHPRPSPGVSPLVQRNISAPGELPGTQPGSLTPVAAASQPEFGQPTGYQVVGTVVATVNNTPIFADRILASLDHELAAEARKYNRQDFQAAATQDIASRINEEIRGQIEIAQAQANLGQDSKNEAHLRAQYWRRQQISAAGGSETIARQRALDSGKTLDQLTQDQYDTVLVQLYLQQRILPRIHITVSDMKRYYDEHLQSDYSTHAEARFRLIRIDFANNGGSAEEAAAKANRIIDDLKAGANFEDEATKFNDDPALRKSGGDIGWIKKGGYKYDAVEQAVWALKPKQFTDRPVEVSNPITGSAFFIAQLLEKRGGTVKSFDDIQVQAVIYNTLHSQQFNELHIKELREMMEKAAVVQEPNGLETAVDMAMQRYPLWASAR
jgi:parvulin-like peptidyl-prolyl isomerase